MNTILENIPADLAGRRLLLDRKVVSRGVAACEDRTFAPYRLESAALQAVTGCYGPAVEIAVSGRTVQRVSGELVVRVKITPVLDVVDGVRQYGEAFGGYLIV